MNAIKTFFSDLRTDEEGAAFLEYTVLLGIILAVSIAVIVAIGAWAGNVWAFLCGQLGAVGTVAAAACPAAGG